MIESPKIIQHFSTQDTLRGTTQSELTNKGHVFLEADEGMQPDVKDIRTTS